MIGQAHLGEFLRRCSEGCFIAVGGMPPRISVGLGPAGPVGLAGETSSIGTYIAQIVIPEEGAWLRLLPPTCIFARQTAQTPSRSLPRYSDMIGPIARKVHMQILASGLYNSMT